MRENSIWSTCFAIAVAGLIFLIMATRSGPAPLWALLIYPAVGGLLAQVASRTSQAAGGIVRLETTTIAAAIALALTIALDGLLAPQGSPHDARPNALMDLAGLGILCLVWWAIYGCLIQLRRRASVDAVDAVDTVDGVDTVDADKAA